MKIGKEKFPNIPPKNLTDFFKNVVKENRQVPRDKLSIISEKDIDELEIISDATGFISEKFGAEKVEVFEANDPNCYNPKNKAKKSLPYKPYKPANVE